MSLPTTVAAPATVRTWQPYPAYKDSGVEWLGEIPAHWEVKRLKYVTRLTYGESLAVESREDGDVPVYGSNGMVGTHSRANTYGPCLIVGRKGSYGKVTYSHEACFAIDTTYFIDQTQTMHDLRWLFYLLPCLGLDTLSQDIGVPGLSRELAYSSAVPLGSSVEQRAIAAFLDRETARIDALVAQKERLIALLWEKRAALISHAVTRGLDPAAPTRDSGVPWLGRVPAHWEVRRLKHVSTLQTGLTLGKEYTGEQLVTRPYLRVANVQDGYLDLSDVATISVPIREVTQYELHAGDVLMTEGGDFDKLGRGYV